MANEINIIRSVAHFPQCLHTALPRPHLECKAARDGQNQIVIGFDRKIFGIPRIRFNLDCLRLTFELYEICVEIACVVFVVDVLYCLYAAMSLHHGGIERRKSLCINIAGVVCTGC